MKVDVNIMSLLTKLSFLYEKNETIQESMNKICLDG